MQQRVLKPQVPTESGQGQTESEETRRDIIAGNPSWGLMKGRDPVTWFSSLSQHDLLRDAATQKRQTIGCNADQNRTGITRQQGYRQQYSLLLLGE